MALTAQQIEETRKAASLHTHPDGRPNAERMARAMGLAPSTVKNRLRVLAASSPGLGNVQVQQSGYGNGPSVEPKVVPFPKPKYRGVPWGWQGTSADVVPFPAKPQSGRVSKILAIGDPHLKPGRTEHMSPIGRHAAQGGFDAVVFIGDVGCLPSLSTHEIPGSVGDMDRPSFAEDLQAINEGLDAFHSGSPVGSVPIYLLYGNHEERAWTAASKMPKTCGDMPARLDAVFTSRGWKTFRYGERQTLFGVDWVHTPLNRMRKPSNGDFAEKTHGLKSVRDLVVGHSHIYNVVTVIKNSERTRVVNLGSAMPWGTVEKYQSPGDPPLDYGICEIRIKDGRIIGNNFIDMLQLDEMYGDKP